MCGIGGWVGLEPAPAAEFMLPVLAALRKRGPDAQGVWSGDTCTLVHARLNILDPVGSPQPMLDAAAGLALTYNGEIYNFRELRRRLVEKGHVLRTNGDTEAILGLYKESGADLVKDLDGMFAFGLYDAPRKRLLLARDRIGIKPLYYFHSPQTGELVFASQLRALLKSGRVPRRLEARALAEYLHFGYAVQPGTWIEGVRQLRPGEWLVWEEGRIRLGRFYEWSYAPSAELSTFDAAYGRLREDLTRSVRGHLVADVPVGSFLSGGIDSSAVTGLALNAKKQDGETLRSFTVRFWDPLDDESERARSIAADLGCAHEEVDALKLQFDRACIDDVVDGLGEPFGDTSSLAVYFLCERARLFGKVALSGDGGDELFLGYGGFAKQRLARRFRLGPRALRRGLVGLLGGARGTFPRRLRKYVNLSLSDDPGLLIEWARRWSWPALERLLDPGRLEQLFPVRDGLFPEVRREIGDGAVGGFLEQQIRFHMRVDLPSDCLFKVDRMSMAHGVEVRVPLLSNDLLDYGSRLPLSMRDRNGRTKEPLRSLAESLSATVARPSPKHGFGFPLDPWLRQDLARRWREWNVGPTLERLGFSNAELERHLKRYAVVSTNGGGFESRFLAARLFELLVLAVWIDREGVHV